jgi:hypothetical protein
VRTSRPCHMRSTVISCPWVDPRAGPRYARANPRCDASAGKKTTRYMLEMHMNGVRAGGRHSTKRDEHVLPTCKHLDIRWHEQGGLAPDHLHGSLALARLPFCSDSWISHKSWWHIIRLWDIEKSLRKQWESLQSKWKSAAVPNTACYHSDSTPDTKVKSRSVQHVFIDEKRTNRNRVAAFWCETLFRKTGKHSTLRIDRFTRWYRLIDKYITQPHALRSGARLSRKFISRVWTVWKIKYIKSVSSMRLNVSLFSHFVP